MPLAIRVSGPTTSMVGKSVVFSAEITNLGQQPLANVVVSQQADAALAVIQATEGATRKGNDLALVLAPPFCPASRSSSKCSATASSRRPMPVAVLPRP